MTARDCRVVSEPGWSVTAVAARHRLQFSAAVGEQSGRELSMVAVLHGVGGAAPIGTPGLAGRWVNCRGRVGGGSRCRSGKNGPDRLPRPVVRSVDRHCAVRMARRAPLRHASEPCDVRSNRLGRRHVEPGRKRVRVRALGVHAGDLVLYLREVDLHRLFRPASAGDLLEIREDRV